MESIRVKPIHILFLLYCYFEGLLFHCYCLVRLTILLRVLLGEHVREVVLQRDGIMAGGVFNVDRGERARALQTHAPHLEETRAEHNTILQMAIVKTLI